MRFSTPFPRGYHKVISLISVILLAGCECKTYYKMCAEECIMHGSRFGRGYYDPTCSDNVTFMVAHWAKSDLTPEIYQRDINPTQPLALYQDEDIPVAMHDPLFPAFETAASTGDAALTSEPVTFSLNGNLESLVIAELYISVTYATLTDADEVPVPATTGAELKYATWKPSATGARFDLEEYYPARNSTVSDIKYKRNFPKGAGDEGKTTFIKYRFQYRLQNEPGDQQEITFALQDFSLKMPVPVYVQAQPEDVVDVLFIPGADNDNNAPSDAFRNSFNSDCRKIIMDHIFKDSTVRYWRTQFNFWLSRDPGRAYDFNNWNGECHATPAIPSFINVSGVLHEQSGQRDFSCNRVFSAYAKDGSIALHEIGHSGFELEDEYRSAGNKQEKLLHFPNNWDTRDNAVADVKLRHKTEDDIKKITID